MPILPTPSPPSPQLDVKLPADVSKLVKTLEATAAKLDVSLAKLAWYDGARTGGFAVGLALIVVYLAFIWKGGRS